MFHSSGMNEHQPEPQVRDGAEGVWDLVIADMKERDKVGRERYGTPLQAFNGRDGLVDAYQEALDLVVYLRQVIAERDTAGQSPVLRPCPGFHERWNVSCEWNEGHDRVKASQNVETDHSRGTTFWNEGSGKKVTCYDCQGKICGTCAGTGLV